MHRFMEKYSDSVKDSDAVKMIEHRADVALEHCKKDKKEYLHDLARVYEMIEDYFSIKGLDLEHYKKE